MVNPDNELPSLDALQRKIDEVRGTEQTSGASARGRDFSQAMRFSIDLFAGVAVGVGAGYFLDSWLGTLPLCMVVGLFIGMAAGVRNMIRSANIIDHQTVDERTE